VGFRLDVPGQYERVQKSIRICPVSGPGLLNKSEREPEGSKSSIHSEPIQWNVSAIVEGDGGVTFREQSKIWLQQMKTRKRKPVKPATIIN
jgi:hypothetical protein